MVADKESGIVPRGVNEVNQCPDFGQTQWLSRRRF